MELLEKYYQERIYSDKDKNDPILRDKLFNELNNEELKQLQNSLSFAAYKLGCSIEEVKIKIRKIFGFNVD